MHAIEAPEELYSAPGIVSTALKPLILRHPEERAPTLRQLGCMHGTSLRPLGRWGQRMEMRKPSGHLEANQLAQSKALQGLSLLQGILQIAPGDPRMLSRQ
jgi:hypothetical protein